MQQPLLHSYDDDESVCRCCTSKRLKVGSALVCLLGLGLLLCAAYIPPAIQHKLDSGIDDFISLSPQAAAEGRDGFKSWSDWSSADSVPVYNSIYFLNLTNSAALLAGNDSKPRVEQVGPYVYREVRVKFDLEWGLDYDNRHTLSYREWVYYLFQRDQTPSHLDPARDRIATLNVPFQAVSYGAKLGGEIDKAWLAAQFLCKGQYDTDLQRLFDVRSPEELLFGFQSCVMNLAPVGGLTPNGYFPGLLGTNVLPGPNVTLELIGNATLRDTIYTGEDDADLARQYVEWKEQQYLSGSVAGKTYSIWGSPAANRVSGTEGSQFARGLKEGSTIVTWVEQLSRHAPLINAGSAHASVHGIDLLSFSLDPRMLLTSASYPPNADYFMDEYAGLLNVSSSKQGLPLFMSKPMFLDADPRLAEGVVGLANATREAHDTVLDVEPLTGATMRARKRLQVNVRVAPFSFSYLGTNVEWYTELGVHFLPLAWIDQHAEIPSGKASKFRGSVYAAQDAIKYIALVGGIVGAALVALALVMCFSASGRAVRESLARAGAITTPGIQQY